jgi:pimeloyl-ACP methyl ester carboxylesterase
MIDDGQLVDASVLGGAIDSSRVVTEKPSLSVPSFVVGRRRFAFVLYRAPRNFDTTTGSTAQLESRTVRITAWDASFTITETLTVVRPLVVFIHGTSADNDAWLPFPLWRDSANEVHGFTAGTLPFHATRISFHWIWNATGGVRENAASILAQLVVALRDWSEATGTAATQADVVTHSFGGFIARQVIQTQPDPNPLSRRTLQNFRAAANWGHGSIHKLITLAATHRGAATANTTAYINAKGGTPGLARETACGHGVYIDKGALRDQMVLSEALKALGESRVPGHAIAGAGRAALDPSGSYSQGFLALFFADTFNGPYQQAAGANKSACLTDTLTNYVFNLDPNVPPVSGSDKTCSIEPNYDLVVSVDSSLGLIPPIATTTAADLGLVGFLNHSAIHDPGFGSAAIVEKVSDRVVFLLTRGTTSQYFSYFPAVTSVSATALEERFSKEFEPAWLDVGTRCPSPSYTPGCPAYAELQVIPAHLRLEDSTPMPLLVYGLLDGEWVVAYSPTSSDSTSRNCPIALTSFDPSVAAISANDVTGAQTVVAAGVGATSITVSVRGAGDLVVPVTVTGTED